MIKKSIVGFIQRNKEILSFLKKIKVDGDNSDKVVVQLADELLKTGFNNALGLDFLLALQLTDDKRLIEEYELSDIRNLFASLQEISPGNLEFYVESAHFEWSVMDDAENAKTIVAAGLRRARQHVAELEEIKRDIENGS